MEASEDGCDSAAQEMSRRAAVSANYYQRWIMKRPGRFLGNLLAMVLTVGPVQAVAETQLSGRDFNHMTTGFPLSGGHATAACETCHVGGVFKGTPRNCDGCHAYGKRVVATPKSGSHIVTDAPCESCHFNTSTFLGARYNHGTAVPGQCTTCHNGRIAQAKPNSGRHLTPLGSQSCDSCHRTSAWSPQSWNHNGVIPGSCETAGCHVAGSNQYYRPANHNSPVPYTNYSKGTYQCDSCHNFVYWNPAPFKHSVAGTCDSCHSMKVGHIATNGAVCSACHRTRSNGWLPASNHSGNEAGICRTCHASTPQPGSHSATEYTISCDACHKSQTALAGASGHTDLVPPHVPTCRSCHSRDVHDGKDGANSSMDCSISGCHQPGGSKGRLFSKWD